jgi:protein TonB
MQGEDCMRGRPLEAFVCYFVIFNVRVSPNRKDLCNFAPAIIKKKNMADMTINMKRTILLIMLAVLTMGVAAQSADSTRTDNDNSEMKSLVGELLKQSPQFPGGKAELMKFLSKNVKYPELAAAYGVEGRVVMTFFVEKDGKISDISAHDCTIQRFNTTKFGQETEARQKELKEQFALLFAKEGARVIRKMPKWEPGRHNDERVRVKYNLPIQFLDPNK